MTDRLLIFLLGIATGVAAGSLCGAMARRPSRAGYPHVRNAGPEAMKHPPRNWDIVDEQADESFPASDPPGNY